MEAGESLRATGTARHIYLLNAAIEDCIDDAVVLVRGFFAGKYPVIFQAVFRTEDNIGRRVISQKKGAE